MSPLRGTSEIPLPLLGKPTSEIPHVGNLEDSSDIEVEIQVHVEVGIS